MIQPSLITSKILKKEDDVMRKKTAVLLIIMLLSYHINVFAEVQKKDGMNNFNSGDSEYPVATDSQAGREDDAAGKPGEETEVLIEDGTYNVSFPANVQAYLDPGNLSGKGQIFSDPYVIENYGSEDVSIKIKNIAVNYWSDEYEYEFSEETVTDQDSDIKKLNINMIWENESENEKKVLNILESEPNEYVLHLRAAEYDNHGEFVKLNEGGRGAFYFTGTLNSNPNLVWEDGEITLSFDYEITSDELKNELDKLSEVEETISEGLIQETDESHSDEEQMSEKNIEETGNIEETNQTETGEDSVQEMGDLVEESTEMEESQSRIEETSISDVNAEIDDIKSNEEEIGTEDTGQEHSEDIENSKVEEQQISEVSNNTNNTDLPDQTVSIGEKIGYARPHGNLECGDVRRKQYEYSINSGRRHRSSVPDGYPKAVC